MSNIKFPNKTNDNKSQETLMKQEKSETNYFSNDIKKKNSLYYSNTIDRFLSYHYPSMKNASPPKEVGTSSN